MKRPAARVRHYTIGIDEVGRGSLAGPVVVAAVAMPCKSRIAKRKALGPLRDSKKLTPTERVEWFEYLVRQPALRYSIARVNPRGIEKLNVSQAANTAAYRAYRRLSQSLDLKSKNLNSKAQNLNYKAENCRIFLDGGLFIGRRIAGRKVSCIFDARTLVKADEKINAVKIASIIAKVTRDRFMVRLAKKYPFYGFEKHKGYGTRAHRAALRKAGPSDAHRLTFLGRFSNLNRKPEARISKFEM